MSATDYDVGCVPEGWRVLWCRDAGCLMSLAWTDDIIDTLAADCELVATLDWAMSQVEHGEHTGIAATETPR